MKKEKSSNNIGKLIAHYRNKQGLSQTGLAELLLTNQNKISRWEIGELVPNGYDIMLLAKALNIGVQDLLKDDSE